MLPCHELQKGWRAKGESAPFSCKDRHNLGIKRGDKNFCLYTYSPPHFQFASNVNTVEVHCIGRSL